MLYVIVGDVYLIKILNNIFIWISFKVEEVLLESNFLLLIGIVLK